MVTFLLCTADLQALRGRANLGFGRLSLIILCLTELNGGKEAGKGRKGRCEVVLPERVSFNGKNDSVRWHKSHEFVYLGYFFHPRP